MCCLLALAAARPDDRSKKCAKKRATLEDCTCRKGYRTCLDVDAPGEDCKKKVKYNSNRCNDAERYLSKRCDVQR